MCIHENIAISTSDIYLSCNSSDDFANLDICSEVGNIFVDCLTNSCLNNTFCDIIMILNQTRLSATNGNYIKFIAYSILVSVFVLIHYY